MSHATAANYEQMGRTIRELTGALTSVTRANDEHGLLLTPDEGDTEVSLDTLRVRTLLHDLKLVLARLEQRNDRFLLEMVHRTGRVHVDDHLSYTVALEPYAGRKLVTHREPR
jgi:hypothetical protein